MPPRRKKIETNTPTTEPTVPISVNIEDMESEMTPTEYFNIVKGKMETISKDDIKSVYENTLAMLKRFMITNQKAAAKKCYLYLETIEKELKIVDAGFTKYTTKDNIVKYIESVAKNAVKIIELENYERLIPDDIIDKIANIPEGLFDKYFIVFTDYTKKEAKKVEKKKQDKDPILFGCVLLDGYATEKMYFIADWIDEYCDLTLDKMTTEYKKATKEELMTKFELPTDKKKLEELIFGRRYE